MFSTIYVVVKLKVEHESDVDPLFIVNEADYSFTSNRDDGRIADTEIIAESDESPV